MRMGCGLFVKAQAKSTGGRAHGPTAMLCFVLVNSLMWALLHSWKRRNHIGIQKTTSLSSTARL